MSINLTSRSGIAVERQRAHRTDRRLEAACTRALRCGIDSYKAIKNILDSHHDQLPLELPDPKTPSAHPHVRGKTYYR